MCRHRMYDCLEIIVFEIMVLGESRSVLFNEIVKLIKSCAISCEGRWQLRAADEPFRPEDLERHCAGIAANEATTSRTIRFAPQRCLGWVPRLHRFP